MKYSPETGWERPFKEPVPGHSIEKHKTGIKGLEVWRFSGPMVADPVPMSYWIVTKEGRIMMSADGLERALDLVGFKPKSEGDAMKAAMLQFMYDDFYVIFKKEPLFPVEAPPEALKEVRMPEVTKEGDMYIVSFYTYYCDRNARWFKRDMRCVLRNRAEVGKGHFRMEVREVWSTQPGWMSTTPGPAGPPTALKKNEK